MTMTREQAAAAVTAVTAERDDIRANLLDLDRSFGKRLLAGANLAGGTKQRWEAASAEAAKLWEFFMAYSAIVDRAAEALARVRRPTGPELAEITTLLTGPSVVVPRGPAPLAQRDLTDSGRLEFTLATAVREMKLAFARAREVVTLAENVWTEAADRLSQISAELDEARGQAEGLADDTSAAALAAAGAELDRLYGTLESDPLSLWRDGRVDTARVDRLREQTAAALARVEELARLREDAQRRIAAVTAAVTAAAAAAADAMSAWERAAAKIAAAALPPPPSSEAVADLAGRLATLEGLKVAGRWPRLAAELDAVEQQVAAATERYRQTEQAAVALVGSRDELRGLLEAYQAKAASLGGAEDLDLCARHERARDLLWTSPCDLSAAREAVTGYQRAVLALGGRGQL